MSETKTTNNPTTITINNLSKLDPKKYSVWVAGFMQQDGSASNYQILQSDGTFAAPEAAKSAAFCNANNSLTITVPNVANSGNNRLIFTVTPQKQTPDAYPITGYTAYPFPGKPGVCPAGPYDIFEFGPNAQYDVSAVDAFGMNLSFTVDEDPTIYGVRPSVSRSQIATAFTKFLQDEPHGKDFKQLLYTSPTDTGYPALIEKQFSAIVSPKDWLAIYPKTDGLNNYWQETVDALFTEGNQLSFYLNGATVGTYTGSSDGAEYKLSGPDSLSIRIPKTNFAGNQPFIQAVRAQNNDESSDAYAAFGQIEAALFEAFSRGVILDGVKKKGETITATHSSDAWTNTANWYKYRPNSYNGKPAVYDVYAKFFHCGTANGKETVFGKNTKGDFAMAYGFSLDENPNVGSTKLTIPGKAWPADQNVPSKTTGNVGENQTVTITIGPWE